MGEVLQIRGGMPLEGMVRIPAAKNSVLPLLAASVLSLGTSTFYRVPMLADVKASMELLRGLGFCVEYTAGNLRVQPGCQLTGRVPRKPAQAMRSSVFYLAPLLHAVGWVTMPLPGGCNLGPRPIDIHLDGLARMGAQVILDEQELTLKAPRGLRAVDYTLRLPSVGATETLLMAATRAMGTTILRNVACEPEIQDLAAYLTACGAQITGAGTSVLVIHGVSQLRGAEYSPMPDRIVAATAAAAVASAGGKARLEHCCPEHLQPVLNSLSQAGCSVRTGENWLEVERSGNLNGVGSVYADVYPGFPTDAAPVTAAALLTAQGQSEFCDTVFSQRFACARGFAAMGANVHCCGRSLYIRHADQLHGARVEAPDLRGGAALVVAALAAPEESLVSGLQHIRRGYGDLGAMLRDLGADVQTVCVP